MSKTAVVTRMLGGTREEIINALSNAWIDGHALVLYRRKGSTGSRKSWAASDAGSRGVCLALMAVKGESHVASLISPPSQIEVAPGGRYAKGGVRLWHVNSGIAKEELYRFLRLSKPEPGDPWPTGYCHFPMYAKSYFNQLCAEHLVTYWVNGQMRTQWRKKPDQDRNEALDCRVYARAAAVSLRLDAYPEQRWAAEQAKITIKRDHLSASKPAWTQTPAPSFKPIKAGDSFLE